MKAHEIIALADHMTGIDKTVANCIAESRKFLIEDTSRVCNEAMATYGDLLLEKDASPIAHWRMGHLRTLRHLDGRQIPIPPCLVRGSGFVAKDYHI